jgi:hypothetical protein
MNTFPILAAFTICVSLAILRASFNDLREAPVTLDLRAEREAVARKLRASPLPGRMPQARPAAGVEANEGLLDHELASADPIQAWLDRALALPADYFPPAE